MLAGAAAEEDANPQSFLVGSHVQYFSRKNLRPEGLSYGMFPQSCGKSGWAEKSMVSNFIQRVRIARSLIEIRL